MSKPLNFAIIGCGRISYKHVQSILASPEAKLAAVCDIIAERMRQKAKEGNCPGYLDYRAMLAKHPEIEVVSVCTESGRHAAIAIDCADAGKHVIVEKPMALTLDDADQMIAKFDQANKSLFVVKQNRFNPPVVKLREALESGRFGKLVLGTVRVRWCRRQDYYDQDAWRGTWAMDGGVFANQASHHIDLLHWCLGEVDSIFAYSATRLVNIEVEDVGIAVLRFRNGALGVIEATTATRPKDLEGSLSLLGERGTVEVGGFAVNQMKVWNFTDTLPGDTDVLTRFSSMPPNVYGFGHSAVYQHVIRKLTTGQGGGALVDGLDGRKSLELITALYESIHAGREVRLHFRPQACRLGAKNADS